MLVPEIALTPQTVRRFTARFPSVAILHSGLTATDRHRYWQQIRRGPRPSRRRRPLGGFRPGPDLGIIVVDEEHEASYKQDQSPRYNARTLPSRRANRAGAGSAGQRDAFVETYYRVGGGSTGEEERGRG